MAEGETKLKMGRAWYAVNDQKREFRYFTGLQEGEVPCSKKEEKEVKRKLNGYTRLLSNGRSKIAIFEDIDKDQQEQELQQDHNPNFEQMYNTNDYQQDYYNHTNPEEGYQNAQEYQNNQHLYQNPHLYQNNAEGSYDPNMYHVYQGEYAPPEGGNVYNEHHAQQELYHNNMYQNMHEYNNNPYQNQEGILYQQQQTGQENVPNYNTNAKQEKNDDDDEYQPNEEDYGN